MHTLAPRITVAMLNQHVTKAHEPCEEPFQTMGERNEKPGVLSPELFDKQSL